MHHLHYMTYIAQTRHNNWRQK